MVSWIPLSFQIWRVICRMRQSNNFFLYFFPFWRMNFLMCVSISLASLIKSIRLVMFQNFQPYLSVSLFKILFSLVCFVAFPFEIINYFFLFSHIGYWWNKRLEGLKFCHRNCPEVAQCSSYMLTYILYLVFISWSSKCAWMVTGCTWMGLCLKIFISEKRLSIVRE